MSDASGNGVCECSIIHPISMSVCHLLYLMAIASPLVVFFESDGWAVDLLDFEEGHVSAIVAADDDGGGETVVSSSCNDDVRPTG